MQNFDLFFKVAESATGVPFLWMKAICMNESSLGELTSVKHGLECPKDVEGSKSQDGKSWGIMQLKIPTAKDFDMLVTPEKLNNPQYSINIASKYLKRLYSLFDGNEEWVVKSYNQGAGNTAKERKGEISGYANEYWSRYLAHKATLEG